MFPFLHLFGLDMMPAIDNVGKDECRKISNHQHFYCRNRFLTRNKCVTQYTRTLPSPR